ncbi:hypothetical protein [Paenibacillus baekrokdamisoli]|uniref:hypothetical protein n=1 Tax=Paenibacillus baekrokdamisoli TaxID=1712516 RepID=UPI001C85B9B1|nr:hypothetical protein [Paenibacillus baekrokdamisoli]
MGKSKTKKRLCSHLCRQGRRRSLLKGIPYFSGVVGIAVVSSVERLGWSTIFKAFPICGKLFVSSGAVAFPLHLDVLRQPITMSFN